MAAAPTAAAPQPQPGPRQPQPAPRQPQPGPRHPRPAPRQPTAPPRQPPMAAPRKPPNPPNPPPRKPPPTRADAVSIMSRQMPVAVAAVSMSMDLRIVFSLSKFVQCIVVLPPPGELLGIPLKPGRTFPDAVRAAFECRPAAAG